MNLNMANREVVDFLIKDYKTKKPFLFLDFANVSSTEMTAERIFATGGKGAPNRVGFDSGRKPTVTIETQITPMKIFAMLAGTDMETTAKVFKREVLAVTADADAQKVTLTESPIANSVFVYKKEDDCGEALVSTVAAKDVTLTDAAGINEVIVYYMVEKTTGIQKVSFKSNKFPSFYTMEGETLYKTGDGELLPYRIAVYKAQPQANFTCSWSNSGDPVALTLTFDVYEDENKDLMDFVLIQE